MDKIIIPVGKNLNLVAEQNIDSSFDREIYIGLETDDGVFVQDLVNVGAAYDLDHDLNVRWAEDNFVVRLYGDPESDDTTSITTIPKRKEEYYESDLDCAW